MKGGSAIETQRESTLSNTEHTMYMQQFMRQAVRMNTFVDKSLFIKAFLEAKDKVIVAVVPKQFFKTANMDMLREFLAGNKKLFQDYQLKIWKEERNFFDKYCKENPIIHMNIRRIGGSTEHDLLESLHECIEETFDDHTYLIEKVNGKYSWSDTKMEDVIPFEKLKKYFEHSDSFNRYDVIVGLKYLSQCLHVYHGKRVYVFIDDYDYHMMNTFLHKGFENELDVTINIMSELMSELFENNDHIERGLINARFRFAEVFSGHTNNIQYYEFLRENPFSPYYGITDIEVKSLFEQEELTLFKHDIEQWYGGYTLTHTEDYVIYRYTILVHLEENENRKKPHFKHFWCCPKYIYDLRKLFGHPLIRKRIDDLMQGDEVRINTIPKFTKEHMLCLKQMTDEKFDSIGISEVDLFLQFLTENAYLHAKFIDLRTSTIRVPNKEIETWMQERIYRARYYVD